MIRFMLVLLLYTGLILYLGYSKGKQQGTKDGLNRLFAVLTLFDAGECVAKIKHTLITAERMSSGDLKNKVREYQKRHSLN